MVLNLTPEQQEQDENDVQIQTIRDLDSLIAQTQHLLKQAHITDPLVRKLVMEKTSALVVELTSLSNNLKRERKWFIQACISEWHQERVEDNSSEVHFHHTTYQGNDCWQVQITTNEYGLQTLSLDSDTSYFQMRAIR